MKNLKSCVIKISALTLLMGILSNLGVGATENNKNFSIGSCVNTALWELVTAEKLKRSPQEGANASVSYQNAAILYEKAIDYCEGKIVDFPIVSLYRNAALAYFELENWDKAIKYYGTAINIEAKPRDHARIAMACMEKCKKHHDEEGSIDPDLYMTLCKLTASNFDIYLTQDPDVSAAYYFDAFTAHHSIGNLEKANQYLAIALQKDPSKLNNVTEHFLQHTQTTGKKPVDCK